MGQFGTPYSGMWDSARRKGFESKQVWSPVRIPQKRVAKSNILLPVDQSAISEENCYPAGIYRVIQEEKVNILGGNIIGHCEKNVYMSMCLILNGYRDRASHCYRRAFL